MKKPYVIAVAGGTCSGKSTLADRLYESLKADYRTLKIAMDAYFKKECPRVIAPITGKEYVEHNHPTTLELDRLFADFEKAISSDEYEVVIIEGLFALYLEEIRTKADLKIFVDLESDERLVRRIRKFEAWGQTFDEITERFLATVRFRHAELIEPTRWHADVVLNGDFDRGCGIKIVEDYIRDAL